MGVWLDTEWNNIKCRSWAFNETYVQMDLTERAAPWFLKFIRKNMTEANKLLLVLLQSWLKLPKLLVNHCTDGEKSFTSISVHMFSEKWLQTLKNIGCKTTRDWTSFLLCPVLVCQFCMHRNHEGERVPKPYELVFLRKPPFLELSYEAKHGVAWNLQSEKPKLATLKTVSGFLIHMRRKPQLLLETCVSNIQIWLFWNHPSLGSPSIHRQEFISLTQGSGSCLWAIIPGNRKLCYPNKSTDYLFSRNNIEQIGGYMCMFYILI